MLAGKQLHRYEVALKSNRATLSAPQVVIATGLEDPQHVTLDVEAISMSPIAAAAIK